MIPFEKDWEITQRLEALKSLEINQESFNTLINFISVEMRRVETLKILQSQLPPPISTQIPEYRKKYFRIPFSKKEICVKYLFNISIL